MVWLLNKKLEGVILTIKNSSDYQECIQLKEKMKKNQELMSLIEQLKSAQKEYVKDGGQNKAVLEQLESQLYEIPIYVVYMDHLNRVNQMITYVEEDLNQYFYEMFN